MTSRARLIEVAAEASYNEATKSADARSGWEEASEATRRVWCQMEAPVVDAILAEQAKEREAVTQTITDPAALAQGVPQFGWQGMVIAGEHEKQRKRAQAFDRMRDSILEVTVTSITRGRVIRILDAARSEVTGDE